MNGNITICSKDFELDIKYGLFDLGEERECARSSLKYILNDFRDIKQSYFRLGFHLHEFKVLEYYKDFGYLSFEEFCEANIDMDKGAISRCINVFLMTNSAGEVSYNGGVKKTGCASHMSDKYKDYSYSQLTEMLPLDEEMRKKVTPEMTVKEIREMKKGSNKKVATSQPDEVRLCINDFLMKKGIVLQNHIKKCQAIRKETIELYDSNGKLIGKYECDLLMSGDNGGVGKKFYRIESDE